MGRETGLESAAGARIVFCTFDVLICGIFLSFGQDVSCLVCRSSADAAAIPTAFPLDSRGRRFFHYSGDQITACAEFAVSRSKTEAGKPSRGFARWQQRCSIAGQMAKGFWSMIRARLALR